MPRRAAKVTQADIARAIRAAKEAGAGEVVVDGEGHIRITLAAPERPQTPVKPAVVGPPATPAVPFKRLESPRPAPAEPDQKRLKST